MADPLSVIASVVGIVGAGTKLAITLYDLCDKAKNAPRSIREIASNLSILSTILENIADILKLNKDVYKEQLLNETTAILKRYAEVQKEVRALIKRQDGFRGRVKWALINPKVQDLLIQIEGVKSALNLVLGLINLAIAIKHPGKDGQKSSRFQRLVESVVRENRQSILALQSREYSSFTEEDFDALKHEREAIKLEKAALRRIKRMMRDIDLDTDASSSDREHHELKLEKERSDLRRLEMMRREEQRKRMVREVDRALPQERQRRRNDQPELARSSAVGDNTAAWLFGLVFGSQPVEPAERELRAEEEYRLQHRLKAQSEKKMMREKRPEPVPRPAEPILGKSIPPPSQIREIGVSDTIMTLLKSWTSLDEVQIQNMPAVDDNVNTEYSEQYGPYSSDSEEFEQEDELARVRADLRHAQRQRERELEREHEEAQLELEKGRLGRHRELQNEEVKWRGLTKEREFELERQRMIAELEARREKEQREAAAERQRIIHEHELRKEKELRKQKIEEEQIIKRYLEKQQMMKVKAHEDRARIIAEYEHEKAEQNKKKKVEREMLLEELRKDEVEARVRSRRTSEHRLQLTYESNPASGVPSDARSVPSDDGNTSVPSIEGKRGRRVDKVMEIEERSWDKVHSPQFKTYTSLDGNVLIRCLSDVNVEDPNHHNLKHTNDDAPGPAEKLFFSRNIAESTAQATLVSTLSNNGFVPMFEVTSGLKNLMKGAISYQSRAEALTASQLWQSTSTPGRSELFEALCEAGWKPLYARGTDAGQTWYHGSRAVHVEFQKTSYIPQLKSANGDSPNVFLLLNSALLEEEALRLSGVDYKLLSTGFCLLDPQLEFDGIISLIASSFFHRESRLRRTSRNSLTSVSHSTPLTVSAHAAKLAMTGVTGINDNSMEDDTASPTAISHEQDQINENGQ